MGCPHRFIGKDIGAACPYCVGGRVDAPDELTISDTIDRLTGFALRLTLKDRALLVSVAERLARKS